MKLEKKHITFACTVSVLIMVLVYRILNPFRQQEVDTLTYGPDTGFVPQKERTTGGGLYKEKHGKTGFEKAVDRYFRENKHRGHARKNLFAAETQRVERQPAPPLKKPEPPEPPEPQKDPVKEAKLHLAQYQFYGSYDVGGTRAVFLGKNKMILVARAGDRIEGKYLIDKIDANEIKIQALDINKKFQLDLEEFSNGE